VQDTDFDRSAPLQPRAIGTASAFVRADQQGVTRLVDLRRSGSKRLVFPQTFHNNVEAIIVNTAGGITGSDRFRVVAWVGLGAALMLTTQAAERAYRAQIGEVGSVTTTLAVGRGAVMNWLPQELILFDRCALRRRPNIALETDARLPIVFGHAAMLEQLHNVTFQDRITISRNERPIYLDGMGLRGDAIVHFGRSAIADGVGAMASLIFVAPEAADQLNAVRASDSFDMRRSLVPILDRLTRNTPPASWRL
jgi:urease accessory protein